MKNNFYLSLGFWLSILTALLVFLCQCGQPQPQNLQGEGLEELIASYIEEWCQFYPSQALAAGDKNAAYKFEDLSPHIIRKWLQFNTSSLKKLEHFSSLPALPWDDRVDARLLRRQIRIEIEKWELDRWQENSPGMYAELISQAVTDILARGLLNPEESLRAISLRLKGIDALCDSAVAHLKNSSPQLSQSCLEDLENSAEFYEENLPDICKQWIITGKEQGFPEKNRAFVTTAVKIRRLAAHIKEKIIPRQTLPDALGKENYRRKLKIYTDSSLTPEELEKISLEEIDRVRQMMMRTASLFWEKQNPGKLKPGDSRDVLADALAAMESHRLDNQQDFLNYFKELIDRVETFIRQEKIVSLPKKRSLFTDLSPAHFAGAAVGGVYPAGPFNPSADTLFYLPTVPDIAPQEVKDGFYRSFNNHFNTMIITHEITPGHYLQAKLAAANLHRVRSLFPDDLYVEGWASLCEQITLDAGWDNDHPLTRLAHLRKRLENAVRAYTSVQVHCNGWNREKLTNFAVERGLLAPQFAINLWDRVMNSPLQLTSYFLGFRGFASLLEIEKQKSGERFMLNDFCDKILHAGAIPMEELPRLF